MELITRIQKKRETVLKQWFQTVLDAFPPQARMLIAKGTDRFSNPIGFTLSEGLEAVLDGLLDNSPPEAVEPALAQIIKLRAIQPDRKEDPLAFLYQLKPILREICGARKRGFDQLGDLLDLEDALDAIIRQGQDIYVQSREKILELQVNEMKNKTHMLRRLAGEV